MVVSFYLKELIRLVSISQYISEYTGSNKERILEICGLQPDSQNNISCHCPHVCVCVCVLELCGAFVVAFGEFQMIHSKFASLITTFWPIYPANTLVITGTIVTCVCYVGVLGGMRENRCMLTTFFILMFFLMLVELAMALVFLIYSREIDRYFERDLTRSLEIYRLSSPEGNKTLKDDFDAVQHLFRCCGVHGEADWKGNVPISCCAKDPCNLSLQTNWKEGCLNKLKNWFAHNYLSTGAGVVTMFIIQFISLSIVIPLYCHFKRRGLGYQ